MAYYDALIAAWNNPTQPPSGVTGTGLTAQMTTQEKLDAVNAWTVIGPAIPALLAPSIILNAIVDVDLAALTQLQVTQLTLLLAGNSVDISKGTTIRSTLQNLFTGKTQTMLRLGKLTAPFDSPVVHWCQANGYPMAQNGGGGLTLVDAEHAGLV